MTIQGKGYGRFISLLKIDRGSYSSRGLYFFNASVE